MYAQMENARLADVLTRSLQESSSDPAAEFLETNITPRGIDIGEFTDTFVC